MGWQSSVLSRRELRSHCGNDFCLYTDRISLMKHLKLIMSLLPVSLAACLYAGNVTAQDLTSGYFYVEAKEWNKKHPELPRWKSYPSMTVTASRTCLMPRTGSPATHIRSESHAERSLFPLLQSAAAYPVLFCRPVRTISRFFP